VEKLSVDIRKLTLTFESESFSRQILQSSTFTSSSQLSGTSLTHGVSTSTVVVTDGVGDGASGAGEVVRVTGAQLTAERPTAARIRRMLKCILTDLC
jgi:hypothetical protein